MSSVQCFYPNGDLSKEIAVPCGAAAGVGCCPQGWACQVNGLCYSQSQNNYGRYTCTDRSWQSPGCPNICTNKNTANGTEAVLQCSPGSYCCDANRPEFSGGQSCCDSSPNRFSIDGNVAISVMSQKPTTAASASATIPTTAPSGGSSIVVVTTVFNQVKSPTTNGGPVSGTANVQGNSGSSSMSTGAIIGSAIGGVVALIAIATIAFLVLRWRRRQPQHPSHRFSLNSNVEPMYDNRRSLRSLFQTDNPELEGSTPDLSYLTAEQRQCPDYESPREIGMTPPISPLGPFGITRESLVSQNNSIENAQPVELPGNEKAGSGGAQSPSELPERSRSKKRQN